MLGVLMQLKKVCLILPSLIIIHSLSCGTSPASNIYTSLFSAPTLHFYIRVLYLVINHPFFWRPSRFFIFIVK